MTTFTDLDALADAQPPDARYGRMLVKVAGRWSYPGCPLDGVNLRLPRVNASDARVSDAITAAQYAVFEVDTDGKAIKVVEAASPFAGRAPIQPSEAGGPRSWPPVVAGGADGILLLRGSPLQPVLSDSARLSGLWLTAWKAGVVPHPSGSGMDANLLALRVTDASGLMTPQAGDRLSIAGAAYTVGSVNALGGNVFDLALSRYLTPTG